MPQTVKKQEIWLYLHFPLLAIDAQFKESKKQFSQYPQAVITQSQKTQCIYCCNDAAKQLGIQEQMSLSTAITLCPDLHIKIRNNKKERLYFEQLTLIAYNFSPELIIYQNIGLSMELSNCKKLYGSYSELLKQLKEQLKEKSSRVFTGVGHNSLAARLSIKNKFHTQIPKNKELIQQLYSIKLNQLTLKRSQENSLKHLGIITVGDFLTLPSTSTCRRFDNEVLSKISLLTTQNDLQERYIAPKKFKDMLENPSGFYSKEDLYAPMKILLARLQKHLRTHQVNCKKIYWQFSPMQGQPKSMVIELSHPCYGSDVFFTLSRLQLEQLNLPNSIERIVLYSKEFIINTNETLDFFLTKKYIKKIHFLDQVTAKLGTDAIYQPCFQAEYLPEKANLSTDTCSPKTSSGRHLPLQPLWLTNTPLRLQNLDNQPYWNEPLTLLRGPERLSENWWQGEQQRDYYVAHDSQGSRYWLYWEKQSKEWHLHGIFA